MALLDGVQLSLPSQTTILVGLGGVVLGVLVAGVLQTTAPPTGATCNCADCPPCTCDCPSCGGAGVMSAPQFTNFQNYVFSQWPNTQGWVLTQDGTFTSPSGQTTTLRHLFQTWTNGLRANLPAGADPTDGELLYLFNTFNANRGLSNPRAILNDWLQHLPDYSQPVNVLWYDGQHFLSLSNSVVL